jgi:hypothetical protein
MNEELTFDNDNVETWITLPNMNETNKYQYLYDKEPETKVKNHIFESTYAIGDVVEFIPMYRDRTAFGIDGEKQDGVIVSVRFTKAKVFYDCLSDYYGVLFRDIDSCNVNPIEKVYLKESL